MKTLYFDCATGVSGNMAIGALLEICDGEQYLRGELAKLGVLGYDVKIIKKDSHGIDGTYVEVLEAGTDIPVDALPEEISGRRLYIHDGVHHEHGEVRHHGHENHSDYDDEDSKSKKKSKEEKKLAKKLKKKKKKKLCGKCEKSKFKGYCKCRGEYVDRTVELQEDSNEHNHEHTHHHDHEHHHQHVLYNHEHNHNNHDHHHEHSHHHNEHDHGHHHHRTYGDIKHIIENSGITNGAKELAKSMFHKVAVAEATVHGKPIDEVHFHEVGALDSIVDIVSVAILMDYIKPDRVISSVVSDGYGTIRCAHGVLSVPVPATSAIYKNEQVRFKQIEVPTELVTPTGAAIVSTFAESYGLMPEMNISKIGIGVGSRNIGGPNTLRIILGEGVPVGKEAQTGDIMVINSNIDDSTGEELGYVLEKLMDAGALDVSYAPIFMKKNRPAYRLEVICRTESRERLCEIIFAETTTIGVRYFPVQREELTRTKVVVETELGPIEAKRVSTAAGQSFTYPEYESLRKTASELGVSIKSVRAAFEKGIRN